MAFPWATVGVLAEIPAGVIDGSGVAIGSILAATGEGESAGGGFAAEVADVPPMAVT